MFSGFNLSFDTVDKVEILMNQTTRFRRKLTTNSGAN